MPKLSTQKRCLEKSHKKVVNAKDHLLYMRNFVGNDKALIQLNLDAINNLAKIMHNHQEKVIQITQNLKVKTLTQDLSVKKRQKRIELRLFREELEFWVKYQENLKKMTEKNINEYIEKLDQSIQQIQQSLEFIGRKINRRGYVSN